MAIRIVRFAMMLALVGGIGACRDRASRPQPAPEVHPPSAAPIVIAVDGVEVARITVSELVARRPLIDLLPADARDPDGWVLFAATSDDGRRLAVPDLTDHYPAHDVMLYLDGNRPSVGVFGRPRSDQPLHVQKALERPAEALIGATRIAIDRTAPPDPAAPLPAMLTVVSAGRTTVFDAARLAALPGLPGKGHKAGGWDLRNVLAAAGVRGAGTMTAVGREGTATIDIAILGQPGVEATLRRNRRGELRLGLEYIDPDAGTSVVVHAVSRLDVVPAVPPEP